ncbi:unnamed protein product [Didymodactylos carnosus]|uniref:NodB homology domain-containing protein n=2 Tax=Didymodactylos carnosus TaxID=1234261 RepID=A0A8S2H3E7_9BILA|nr:unnamed protein product [Didymodactylos carnosus]CAF3593181.1 unnamed protein product [Didymodactylos carnosus]
MIVCEIYPFHTSNGIVYGCPSFSHRDIHLTFDDGPSNVTSHLLDTLKYYNIKATFFIIGVKALKYPDIVKKIKNEGHTIGSHTLSHKNLTFLESIGNYSEIEREILENEQVLKNITGVRPWLFRPPYGAITLNIKKYLNHHNYTVVMWNGGNVDWFYKDMNKQTEMLLMGMADAGGIVCFHDRVPDTSKNISIFIKAFMDEQHKFISSEECLAENM